MNLLDQSRTPILDALLAHLESNVVPFHVPGHKHGQGNAELRSLLGGLPLRMDLNGMPDLDDICNPISCILESQQLAASAFGAQSAHYLLNGNTQGIHTMMLAAVGPGEQILLPRNCHKSAITGLILSGGIPAYIPVEVDRRLGIATGPTIESVQNALQRYPTSAAVFFINPSYYGTVQDIGSLTAIAHARNVTVLVDEAHGSHIGFHPDLPVSAMSAGADLSAASLHKTGGSLTQSAILLAGTNRIKSEIVKESIDLVRTTSGSYLLMASLELARKNLAMRGRQDLEHTLMLARTARDSINAIDGLYAPGLELCSRSGPVFNFDETKLVIHVTGIGYTGFQIERILRDRFKIQLELADMNNVLAVITIGDTESSIARLVNAMKLLALEAGNSHSLAPVQPPDMPEVVATPRTAFYSPKKFVSFRESAGHIAGEMIISYPPGIPVVCPGERITNDIIEYVTCLKAERSLLQGTADPEINQIRVLGS
ncbi:MAG: aminotransferase class I/II-fold pyridoxal phosphate-dependent enzyme [Spirochaetia bacterium]|nr:aminotransferase class I/II-fold pyridoxal phosphate-dependent enzyme [Spirochaetia bacterium]